MSDGFSICDGCGRHVRAADAVCPFCQMTITAAPRAIADAPGPRISRAAILASAMIVAGCHSRDPSPAPIYGGPPEPEVVEGPEASVVVDAGPAVPWVNSEIVDAGASDASKPAAAGTKKDAGARASPAVPSPAYGGPPPGIVH